MRQKFYIVSASWYTNDEGYGHDIYLVTTDWFRAHEKMNEVTDYVRSQDIEDGWTIVDDTEEKYFSHKEMPEYYMLQIDEKEVNVGITIE